MKSKTYTVSEYDYLFHNEQAIAAENHHLIDRDTFDVIKNFILSNEELNQYIHISSKKYYGEVIHLQNYVGVIQTKQNISIEILPKIHKVAGNIQESKRVFLRMLKRMRNSPFKKIKEASLQKKNFPVLEVFISLFLDELNVVVKQGLKKNYESLHDNIPYLKGKLDVMNNMRQNFIHKERFVVDYDEFTENVAENRLIKSTLLYLSKHSRTAKNQKTIREMIFIFDDVDVSKHVTKDLQSCNIHNRLQNHYAPVMKWVQLFLNKQSLVNFAGEHISLALLFPMERVFEDYVAYQLKKLYPERELKTQDRTHYLVEEHCGDKIFQIRPDLVMTNKQGKRIVLDTKWKLIDQSNKSNKYGISQSDMYQLYAYAEKFETSQVYLIYPRNDNFKTDLAPFYYRKEKQELRVVGYDLLTDSINISGAEIFE